MQLSYNKICNSLDYELEEAEKFDTLTAMREELLSASYTLTKACEAKLASAESLEYKELKALADIIKDLQNAYFGRPEVVVQNIQNNISNNQLNFFKSIMQNEI